MHDLACRDGWTIPLDWPDDLAVATGTNEESKRIERRYKAQSELSGTRAGSPWHCLGGHAMRHFIASKIHKEERPMKTFICFARRNGTAMFPVLLVLLLLLGACGEDPTPTLAPTEAAQAPTSTPVPPTNTPVPPTDTPIPPTDTPVPPTDTPIPPTDTPEPTDTSVPPTDTPPPPTDTPEPTPEPTETPIPTPEATNTPKPTAKPTMGKILFTSNRASWDDIFVMNEDGSGVKQLTTMGKCYNQ